MTWSGPRTQPPTAWKLPRMNVLPAKSRVVMLSLKHYREEFTDMPTLDDYAKHTAEVMTHWTERKDFTEGRRTLFWHKPSGTHVWRSPGTADGGSAFRPQNGKNYFDGQKR